MAAIVAIGGSLAACTSMGLDSVKKDPPKLSSKMMAQMSAKSMRPESPVLVRIFKQESELEQEISNKKSHGTKKEHV